MLTLYFLQTSRAFRIAWLLEELGLEYELKYADRNPDLTAPSDLKIPTSLGKSPAILDDGISIGESGAITEYLVDKYDQGSRLWPLDPVLRSKIREFMWASEGTFFMHALPIWRLRQYCEGSTRATEALPEIEAKYAAPVRQDFDWLENELGRGQGDYLVGDQLTVADTMMAFTIQFITAYDLGLEKKSWPRVSRWLRNVESREAYKRAVQKTGHHI
ncbi:glutathione S-transferase [Xylogone sp. PMI_703]|nr:glutathione S-transferase [Xylogone sp. PMI_703]